MKNRHISILILFIILSSLSIAWQISPQVQTSPEIEHLQINLWPEYDRPSVLVMYQIRLNQGTALPAAIAIHIPSGAQKPYNIAMRDQDGTLYNLDYKIIPDQDGLRIELITPVTEVQIEYYDPNLVKNARKRSFSFHWKNDYTVHSLTINVQQPSDSDNMTIIPSMGNGRIEQDGVTYFTLISGEKIAGSSINLQLSYEKSNDTLSAIQQPVQAVQPVTNQTPGRATLATALPWTLAALGGISIFGAVLWFWASEKKYPGPISRSVTNNNNPSPGEKGVKDKIAKTYCQQCGKRNHEGDIYCRFCGTRLRLN